MAPVHELRRTKDGSIAAKLETADVGEVKGKGVEWAQPFVAKGRDGKTDIYGVVCWPRNFDPKKKYPIIENIYAGPQDSFVPKAFFPYLGMQKLSDLGFVVVQIDGMGTRNRGKAFHDVCWKNIADAGFPDRIAWMKALAAKYPGVDISRVGVYGTSAGGQNSTAAVLFHPEFYKVAVSSCGCHDNRMDKVWWNEQWMGYPVGPEYEAQSNITNAGKLEGNLLLMVGELDTNVPPESTYRLIDALERAKKNFDFVVISGADHTDGGDYGDRKRRDFFVKHLLGVDAPKW
jgi:dipeptidyl aminopeptidase/acylaminoacyl peptidase